MEHLDLTSTPKLQKSVSGESFRQQTLQAYQTTNEPANAKSIVRPKALALRWHAALPDGAHTRCCAVYGRTTRSGLPEYTSLQCGHSWRDLHISGSSTYQQKRSPMEDAARFRNE